MHALDETTGEPKWTFTAGARIDSPPTIYRGRVVFGGADGWVYCLTTDGELAWRYRAAPLDRRTMAYEQLESLWPVHGSVLIRDDTVYCVAGRSIFLDGGLRLLRLDLQTGKKLSETIMDEKNPETGNNMQEKLQILQMPVGLPDILSCDGTTHFHEVAKVRPGRQPAWRSVRTRATLPHKLPSNAATMRTSLLRWVSWMTPGSIDRIGCSVKVLPAVTAAITRPADSRRRVECWLTATVTSIGYGRKPEYLRWTTTLEHQLFAAEPNPPEIPENFGKKGGGGRAVRTLNFRKPKPGSDRQTVDGRSLDHVDQTARRDRRSRWTSRRICIDAERWQTEFLGA